MVLMRRCIVPFTAAMLLTIGRAAAEPIQLTTGSLDWHSGSTAIFINLGSDEFTFSGAGSLAGGIFSPWNQCSVPECVGGTAVDLTSYWSGSDLPGTAT